MGDKGMKSSITKRSIVIGHHKTSVSLEDDFWNSLKEIARGRRITRSGLVAALDSKRQHGNLSSAIRLFVLDFYRSQVCQHVVGPSLGMFEPDARRPPY
jgi:predicted DNA-binding ribbon-helix-helix protein